MVHGKNIKRRGKVKVTRRARPKVKFTGRQFSSELVKAQWDQNKTLRQNYEAMGIEPDPNSLRSLKESDSRGRSPEEIEEQEGMLFDVPESDNLRGSRRGLIMSEEEQAYLRRLMAKYGEDYEAMFRDIKLNSKQWTAAKLKRRCARLVLVEHEAKKEQN